MPVKKVCVITGGTSGIGLQYKFFCFLVKILPAKTLNWLVGLIYAK